MMESPPASPLEMGEAEFALEFLIVAFDAPAQFRGIDENFDRSVFGQGREPVFGRLALGFGPLDQQPFERLWGRGAFAVSAWRAVSARRRSARSGFGWSPHARTRLARLLSAASSPAPWPRPADDPRRAACARACVRVRSTAWAAEAPSRGARR